MNVTRTLIRKRLIKKLKEQGIVYKNLDAEIFLCSFMDLVLDFISEEHRIELKGFGSFEVVERKARIGRNPRTGKEVAIKAYKEPIFKFSKKAKKIIFERQRDNQPTG